VYIALFLAAILNFPNGALNLLSIHLSDFFRQHDLSLALEVRNLLTHGTQLMRGWGYLDGQSPSKYPQFPPGVRNISY
jgi:hypothetical protein